MHILTGVKLKLTICEDWKIPHLIKAQDCKDTKLNIIEELIYLKTLRKYIFKVLITAPQKSIDKYSFGARSMCD